MMCDDIIGGIVLYCIVLYCIDVLQIEMEQLKDKIDYLHNQLNDPVREAEIKQLRRDSTMRAQQVWHGMEWYSSYWI